MAGGVARPDLLSPVHGPRPPRLPRLTVADFEAAVADGAELPPDEPMLLHCGHGERAMSAASLLERAGHHDVAVFAGGPGSLGPLEREA